MRLAAAFPLAHVPESTITLYRSKLENCDQDLLAHVIETAISNYKKFPTIAELREDYRTELRRPRTYEPPALPAGRAPMPKELKDAIHSLAERMKA